MQKTKTRYTVVTRRDAYIDYSFEMDVPEGHYPTHSEIEDAFWVAYTKENGSVEVSDRYAENETVILVRPR